MITKLHHRTAQTCVWDMWCVDWFNNERTFGTFGEADFWEFLTNDCEEEDVLEIRKMIDQEEDCDTWDTWVEALVG